MRILKVSLLLLVLFISIFNQSCKKDEDPDDNNNTQPVDTTQIDSIPQLIFKFKFDSTQTRLNNLGQAAPMPAGHGGQSPRFKGMSAHYIELSQGMYTAVGS